MSLVLDRPSKMKTKAYARARIFPWLGKFSCIGAVSLALFASHAYAQATPSAYTTGYRYDPAGRVLGTILPDPDGTGPVLYVATRNTIDTHGLITRTEKGVLTSWQADTIAPANWTGFTVSQQVDYLYDQMGRKVQETVSLGGSIQAITQYSYDSIGRLQCSAVRMNSAAFPSSVTAAFPKDACSLGAAGSQGNDRITYQTYDAYDRVQQIIRGYGSPNQQNYVTYTRTAWGDPQTSTDANGNMTTLNYDQFGRLTSMYFPSPATAGTSNSADYESYGYDANGNRTSFRRRNGQTYGYVYDALNRQTQKTRSDNKNLDVNSTYDLLGDLLTASFADGSGTITNTYDNLGRQLSAMDMYGRKISYKYDADSDRTLLTYPDNVQQTYQYNQGDMLTFTGTSDLTVGETPKFDALGRVTSVTRSNSANTSIGYDAFDRVTSLGHSFAGGARDISWGFTYGQASQILSWTASNTIYDYHETSGASDSRTYNGLNQDSTVAAVSGGYDADGNLANEGTGGRAFTYDIDNHLISLSGPASGTLTYDPLGRLASTTFNGALTTFLYDGVNLIGEYGSTSSTASLLVRYMHTQGADHPFVQFAGTSATLAVAKFLYANYQGSIIALADSSGIVADSDIYRYGPYGEPENAGNSISFAGSRFRYTGQTVLPEASLYYYKARVYDPTYGRFLQTDPIGSKDDLDLYAYTKDDPVDGTDPTGTEDLRDVYPDVYRRPAPDESKYAKGTTMGAGIEGGAGSFFGDGSAAIGGTVDDKGRVAQTADVGGALGPETPGGGGGIYIVIANGQVEDQKGAFSTTNLKGGIVAVTNASGTNDQGQTVVSTVIHVGVEGFGATKGASNTGVAVVNPDNHQAATPTGPCTGRSCSAPGANPPAPPTYTGCSGRSCLARQ